MGHLQNMCSSPRSAAGIRAVRELEILSVTQGEKLKIPVCINDVKVSMVVDTGSPVSIIPHAVAVHCTVEV